MLKLALEGAGFISAYDRDRNPAHLGVRPPETLDERAAQEIAVKQGLGVVVSGALERQGSGYSISVKATQPVTGNLIAKRDEHGRQQRPGPGGQRRSWPPRFARRSVTTRDSGQCFAMDTLSAASLDVVRRVRRGDGSAVAQQFDEALQSFSKSVELDPKFGLGYAGHGLRIAESGQAAGRREIREGSPPSYRQHDGARTFSNARPSTTG